MAEGGDSTNRTRDVDGHLVKRLIFEPDTNPSIVHMMLESFAEETSIEFDTESLRGRSYPVERDLQEATEEGQLGEIVHRLFSDSFELPLTHQWRVHTRSEQTVVTEEVYAPRGWLIGSVLMLWSCGALLLWLALGLKGVVPLNWSLLLVGIVFLVGMAVSQLPVQGADVLPESELRKWRHVKDEPFMIPTRLFLLATIAGGYAGAVGFSRPLLLSAALLFVTGVLVLVAFEDLARLSMSLPSPVTEYLNLVILLTIGLFAYGYGRVLTRRLGFLPGEDVIILSLLVLFSLGGIDAVRNWLDTPLENLPAFASYLAGDRYGGGRMVHVVATVLLGLITYALVLALFVLSIHFISAFQITPGELEVNALAPFVEFGLVTPGQLIVAIKGGAIIALVSLAVPALFFGVGIFVQTATAITQFRWLFAHGSPLPASEGIRKGIDVRLVDTGRFIATSLSVAHHDYVFVSERWYGRLDDGERAALLAHEEGHVLNGDARVSFTIPWLASALLLGQNLLFGIFDFRTREFRADAYAAETAGESELRSLLETLGEGANWSYQYSEPGGASWSIYEWGPTWWQTYLSLFFGNFTLTKAHPSVDERLDALDAGMRKSQ